MTSRVSRPHRTGSLRTKRRYDAYIDSPAWRHRRTEWVRLELRDHPDGIRCVVCGRDWDARRDDLHHINYRHLGTERHEDLVPVHRAGHDEIHALLDGLRLPRRLPLPIANRHVLELLGARGFECAADAVK